MYGLSSSSWPSIRTWQQLNARTIAGKDNIAKLNQLTQSEVTGLTSSLVNVTALAIKKSSSNNSFGLPIKGPDRKQPEGSGLGHEPPSNGARTQISCGLAGLNLHRSSI
jgi:hypothetical protein